MTKSVESAKRIIISGGGTGGHIFPAIAIANALKRLDPATEILFVGAKGRMEMERVPAAGYEIIGLNVQGIQRKSILKNLLLPFRLLGSVLQSISIINRFKPDAAVGVGGYASGPLLYAASWKKIPYLIQEQNSFAGITNKKLGKKAAKICVAFDGMEQFFPSGKIIKTGNPVRKDSVDIKGKREQALKEFKLSADKKTILVTGGSLGARTLNESVLAGLDDIKKADVQLVWQTGKFYFGGIKDTLGANIPADVRVLEFLTRMDLAYAAADVIISRAGAGTIAELCVVGKPVILVPSPNVAEDHQTKNAQSLVKENACEYIPDRDAIQKLVPAALELLKNEHKQKSLGSNISKLALPDADEVIAKEVFKMVKQSS
ncbi:MAG TPA: undecaprenyldiphospho-muramoylpentapeptide beta-N-acetylglucosaminyltransferase [Mucilaginibacter sp.]|nr:undecaprenyldiphospho-muramoylpentapeptide beta-N-acetylglucosaminyltransferase [Mucilaginibacter sp.]